MRELEQMEQVVEAVRELMPGCDVQVHRARYEPVIDEYGKERYSLARDDAGVGTSAVVMVSRDLPEGRMRMYRVFEVELLFIASGREVAEMLVPEMEYEMERARHER